MKSYFIFILLVVISWSGFSQPPADTLFRPPMDIPLRLSGTFHELRGSHFHAGIDIKTQQRTGVVLRSIADGYVYRVNVSGGGYGRALYIRHDTLLSVYAHMKSFAPRIEAFVKHAQYKLKSYEVNLFLPPYKYRIKRGDTIGLSGNSGSSAGPHLHFEVRDFKSEHPRNALNYGISIADNRPPVLYDMFVYHFQPGTTDTYYQKEDVPMRKTGKGYSLYYGNPLKVKGPFALGIRAYDYLNHSHNRCGLYQVTVTLDKDTMFHFRADELAFRNTRYINSLLDREAYFTRSRKVMKLYREPHNDMLSYKNLKNSGVIDLQDDSLHTLKVAMSDHAGNQSTIRMKVKKHKKLEHKGYTKKENLYLLDYRKKNVLNKDGMRLNLPAAALYTHYRIPIVKRDNANYGASYTIGGAEHVFHKNATLSIQAAIPRRLQDKVVVIRRAAGRENILPARYSDGEVVTKIRQLGAFKVGVDTVPPEIRPLNIYENKRWYEGQKIRFRIDDEQSGIGDFEAHIDGKWVLMEYDAKYRLLFHKTDKNLFSENMQKRSFLLKVTDKKGNEKTYQTSIYY